MKTQTNRQCLDFQVEGNALASKRKEEFSNGSDVTSSGSSEDDSTSCSSSSSSRASGPQHITSSSKRNNKGSNNRRGVAFGMVRVRHHLMTLGDNPEALGIPVALSWEAEGESEYFDMESFEKEQQSRRRQRREQQSCFLGCGAGVRQQQQQKVRKISPGKRAEIAREHHSRASITRIEDESAKIRIQRLESGHDDVEEALAMEKRQARRQRRRDSLGCILFWK